MKEASFLFLKLILVFIRQKQLRHSFDEFHAELIGFLLLVEHYHIDRKCLNILRAQIVTTNRKFSHSNLRRKFYMYFIFVVTCVSKFP